MERPPLPAVSHMNPSLVKLHCAAIWAEAMLRLRGSRWHSQDFLLGSYPDRSLGLNARQSSFFVQGLRQNITDIRHDGLMLSTLSKARQGYQSQSERSVKDQ